MSAQFIRILSAFHVEFAKYDEILPDARSKISKLKFTLATLNIIGAVNRTLGDRLVSETTATKVHNLIYVTVATVVHHHDQHLGVNNKGMRRKTLLSWVFLLNNSRKVMI